MKLKKGYIISGSNPDMYRLVTKIRPLSGISLKEFPWQPKNFQYELNSIFPWRIITTIFRIKE